ncbi:MAG: hypothetical protein IBX55_23325 [Methyloprofundus sp.]|nr:hypothetical protein [Methyloprofundus sp.]
MNDKSLGRTFLKSTQHVKVLEQPEHSWRSVLVGLQCGILFLPYEIVSLVLWPLIYNLAIDIYQAAYVLCLVFKSAAEAIKFGFMGYLEASDEPFIVDIEDE